MKKSKSEAAELLNSKIIYWFSRLVGGTGFFLGTEKLYFFQLALFKNLRFF
jgi:hypothetical protein